MICGRLRESLGVGGGFAHRIVGIAGWRDYVSEEQGVCDVSEEREGCGGEGCATYLETGWETRDFREIIIHLRASGRLYAFAGDS